MACMSLPLNEKSALAFTDCQFPGGYSAPKTAWVPSGRVTPGARPDSSMVPTVPPVVSVIAPLSVCNNE